MRLAIPAVSGEFREVGYPFNIAQPSQLKVGSTRQAEGTLTNGVFVRARSNNTDFTDPSLQGGLGGGGQDAAQYFC